MNRKNGTTIEIGEFGPIYRQFKGKPKEAALFLRQRKEGECVAALHRPGIGDISLIWGKVTNAVRHQGYGLAHIIDKHEIEIKALGYSVEDFISILVQNGRITNKEYIDDNRIVCNGDGFRFIVQKAFRNKKSFFLLTAFSPKKPRH